MTSLSTTHDHLYQGRLAIEQPVGGYRFGTDAMLLAASVEASEDQHVLELGCGVGAALLACAARCEEARFTGIEREADYIRFFKANIAANAMERRVAAVHGDITDKAVFDALGRFDHVMGNPPFFTAHDKDAIPFMRRVARQEEPEGLAKWLQAANRFLKPKGTITFIHNAERISELVDGLKKFCGNIRIFPIFPTAAQPAKRVVVQGTKGSRAPILILPGLVLHEGEDKHYTDKAIQIIHFGKNIWD